MNQATRDYQDRLVHDIIKQSFLSSEKLSAQEKQLNDDALKQVLRKQLDADLKVAYQAYEANFVGLSDPSAEERRKPRLYQVWLYETFGDPLQRRLINEKLNMIRLEIPVATGAPAASVDTTASASSGIHPPLARESLVGAAPADARRAGM